MNSFDEKEAADRKIRDRIMTQDLYNKVVDKSNEIQDRLVMYIVGLSVSCIAFTTYLTKDDVLRFKMWSLAIAVLLWISSITFGLLMQHNRKLQLEGNSRFLYGNLVSGRVITPAEFQQEEPQYRLAARRSKNFYLAAMWSFAIGTFFFIIWRIADMLL